jgi:hypothetical protein
LHLPADQNRGFKVETNLNGEEFVFKNEADRILFRTRMAAALLSLLLAPLVFAMAREMFGTAAAFLALALLAFDPNILAHGALVTTDEYGIPVFEGSFDIPSGCTESSGSRMAIGRRKASPKRRLRKRK